jgi:sodium-dependent phosphate cotransporter
MLVAILQKMLLGMSTRIVYKATDVNGYIAIAIGAAITMLVQSSSITTSTLTPLVGMGVIRLEQMYPLTLGANIGTTGTALLAALVSEGTAPLQVALAHLFFNISGIAIFYPIPFMRRIPLYCARQLGKATRVWRGFPILYIAVMFVLVPMIFLGLSALFEEDGKGFTVLASFITIFIAIGVFYTIYHCQFKGGKEKCGQCMANREKKRMVLQDLPEDMVYLKARMTALIEHTGLPVEDEADAEKADDEEAEVEA